MVSVRVITYMHESYIRDCLEGILMQKTTFPVEVNIHDDASTDGTQDIIRAYAKRYPSTIRTYFQVENSYNKPDVQDRRGAFKAMFRGRYVAKCEGDDYWTHPLKLQQQIDFLEQHPDYAGCFHNAVVTFDDGSPDDLYSNFEWNNIDRNRLDYDILDVIAAPLIPTASFVIRYEPKRNPFNFLKRAYSGDMVSAIRVASTGKLRYIDACMSVYRKHAGGVTQHHQGDFVNVNRIYMYLRLMVHLKGRYFTAFRSVIFQHVQNISRLSAIPWVDRLQLYSIFPWYMMRRTIREIRHAP